MNDLQVAQSRSGKWHILGPEGCLSVAADRIKAVSVQRIRDDKRRREWCSYCERKLRIIELEQKADRLETILEATDPTAWVAPVRTRKDKVWHADPECSHAADDPREWTLTQARADGMDPCKGCVLEANQPETQDRSHYQRLVEAGEKA